MEEQVEILRKCANDLIYFGKQIDKGAFSRPSPEFHYEIAELFMDRVIPKVMIEAPRGGAKSHLITWMAIHHYIFDKDDKVIVIQSKTRGEAIKRLRKIKNIIEYDERFIELFGYHGEKTASIWREDYIKFRFDGNWVTIGAIGTGQQVRGFLEDNTRITLFLPDDPEDEKNTLTSEQIDKNYDSFLAALNSLDLTKNGRCLLIGTPIVGGCLVERVKKIAEKSKGWVVRVFEAYDGTPNNLLWPEMWSYQWLEDKRLENKAAGKIAHFYRDYRCNVNMGSDAFFNPENFRYWDGYVEKASYGNVLTITHLGESDEDLKELQEPVKKPVNIFLGVDPASSTKQSADFSVTMPIAYDGTNIYVLPYYRKRVPPTAHAEQIIDMIKMYKPTRAHVETVGYQEMLRQVLKDKLREDNLWVSGLEIKFNPRSEKNARLESLHQYFYNKRVYMKPDMKELYDELVFYPLGEHDDTLDGLFYSTVKLITPYHEIPKKEVIHFAPIEDREFPQNKVWMMN